MSVDPLTLIQNLIKQYQDFLSQNAKTLLGFNELALKLYAKKALKSDLESKGYGIGIYINDNLVKVISVNESGNLTLEDISNPPNGVNIEATELPTFEVENSNPVTSGDAADVTIELKLVEKDDNGNWTDVTDVNPLWIIFAYADTVNLDVSCDSNGNINDYSRVSNPECFFNAGLGGKCDYVGYVPKYTLHGQSKVMLTPIPLLSDIESILNAVTNSESTESTENAESTESTSSTENTESAESTENTTTNS